MNQNVPIIGGGITNRPPLPDDLMQYTCPDHLVKQLGDLTRLAMAEVGKEQGTYLPDRGTVAFKSVPNPHLFYKAANLARKQLGIIQWPNFETWARANGIAEVVAQ